tara:strand:- start:1526 stop:2056 length:531 start_codon:yes stop_codon:yes gene_type:complete
MNINNEIPTTNYNDLFSKHYFLKVAKEIIKISNLENQNTILDYGCGEKIFSQLLTKPKIFNYDTKQEYNEVSNVKDHLNSDVVIFNHVWMYIPYEEISKILNDIKSSNRNSKIILSMGKQNFISKIAMFLAGKPKAHNNTVTSYSKQLEVLKKFCKILNTKKNIYFMTDVFYAEFY